ELRRKQFVGRVRFEDDNGLTEITEIREPLEMIGVEHFHEYGCADDFRRRKTKPIWVLPALRPFEVETKGEAGGLERRSEKIESDGHDRIGNDDADHRQNDHHGVGAQRMNQMAE